MARYKNKANLSTEIENVDIENIEIETKPAIEKIPNGYAKVVFKSNLDVGWKIYKKWEIYILPIRYMQKNWMCQMVEKKF